MAKHYFTALAVVACASSMIAVGRAEAAVVIIIQRAGPDVVATINGSLNLTGLTNPDGGGFASGIMPSIGLITTGGNISYFTGVTGPADFGLGGFRYASSVAGDAFYLWASGGIVGAPTGYVSGTALSASATFAGSTLASLGATVGSYIYTAPADTITVNIGAAVPGAVPEPSTWALMLLGFGAIGAGMRRRQRQAVSYKFA